MNFINRFKHTLLTLRFSILSIFVTLFVVAILVLIGINYNRYSKTMIFIASQLMQQAAHELYSNFKTELTKVKRDNEIAARLIKEGILDPEKDFEYLTKYIADLNLDLSIVQQAYWCDENGDCINSLEEPNRTVTSDLIFNSKKPPYREYLYRNAQGNIIKKSKNYHFDYDPRNRPWYIFAKKAKKTIWTDAYPLKEQPYLAFTVATPIFNDNGILKGVFGMDIRLDWLSAYMKNLRVSKNAVIFIVDKEGRLIAFPKVYEREKQLLNLLEIHKIDMPAVSKSFDLYQKLRKDFFIFSYQGKTYLAKYLISKDDIVLNWMIGVVVPEDDFTAELKQASLLDVEIGLVILILGIILVSAFVTRIVRPIKTLVKETDKIKHFNLEEEEGIQSRIKEVMLLTDAIHSMKSGLKSFQKYVPKTLVRQLIETGENVRMGGTKRCLTIFFSDIKDFTTIAENMDPTELLTLMGEYFEELSRIIVSEKGTIDKYIGDSIMAFWGAPLLVKNPCHAAARAALRCKQRLDALNNLWKNHGKPPLVTRFGLHMGNVVVGNVGSSERLNYTALGDAINVASRLEGVNKMYGTFIMVSETVYNVIKNDFILRKIDYVAVKGKIRASYIYELLAENGTQLSFDIAKYRENYELAFAAYEQQHWDEAISAFKKCLEIYPEDTVGPFFINRCLNQSGNFQSQNSK